MTEEEARNRYEDYLEGHIGNVQQAIELFNELQIPFVVEHLEELREIAGDHDKSKYSDPEWTPYLHHFYPTSEEQKLETEAFEQACRHHIKNNKHHWDYWIDEDNNLQIDDENEYKLYTVERCADWVAMAAQRDEHPANGWYQANKGSMIMPDYGFELCEEIFNALPEDYASYLPFHQTRGKLDEALKEDFKVVPGGKGWLLEASMSKLKRDTLTQDPTRAKKSKNVESKYIGISKYGVLNFETTSETHSGVKWYQEVHFPSLSGFMNIVEQGDEIDAVDVQKAMKSDNIKISCDDPSFLYWAWKYKAWRDVYGLEKETRAPKRNNTQLKGALCKHLYSVIELLGQKRIIDLITRDINEFCKRKLGMSSEGYQDSPEMLNKDLKANQYDYNIEDVYKALLPVDKFNKWMEGTPIEELDLTDEEISDIDKSIKSMRSSSQFALRSELEKQFAPVKRGRKITRDDIKLQVGNSEEEEKGNE